MKKYYIDLFAGCGGLSLGLYNAGWKGLFAIEKNNYAFETLRFNLIENRQHFDWPSFLPLMSHDINEVITTYADDLNKLRGKVTLVAGGPPCQGFSIAGQRDEKDARNQLINAYVDFVSLVQPKMIFFENVKGFTMEFKNNKQKGIRYSEVVKEKLENLGYHIHGELVNFGEYGIPQKRTRFILIGVRKDIKNSSVEQAASFFQKMASNKFNFLEKKGLTDKPTIQEAIEDLVATDSSFIETPDRAGFKSSLYKPISSNYQKNVRNGVRSNIPNSHSFAKHTPNVTNRLRYILSISTECKNLDKHIKQELGLTKQVLVPLHAHAQAPTITATPDDMVHYCEPRILTVRECARLQSFPDWFEFKGKYTTGGQLRKIEVPRYTQVGNAIPPLFSEQSGLILKKLLDWKN